MSDLHGPAIAPLLQPAIVAAASAILNAPGEPSADLAGQFDEVFAQLDRQAGSHNLVSLVDLRRVLPYDRPIVDGTLQKLRRAGRYVLKLAEGRHGTSPVEQEAGIWEEGRLLLYVARKLT
jgi:hypothetical protein